MRFAAKILAAFGGLMLGLLGTAFFYEINGLKYMPAVGAPIALAFAVVAWIFVSKSQRKE